MTTQLRKPAGAPASSGGQFDSRGYSAPVGTLISGDDFFGFDREAVIKAVDDLSSHVPAGRRTDEFYANRFATASWSVISEPGDEVAGELIAAVGPARAYQMVSEMMDPADIAAEAGMSFADIRDGMERWAARDAAQDTLSVMMHGAGIGASLVAVDDEEFWPAGFADLGYGAPHALWTRGDVNNLKYLNDSVTVVGSRASTGYGEHVTMETCNALAAQGTTIVSGAAYGIDGMAHRAALANGGSTIAFLAGGPDRFYPSGHDTLLNRIVDTGLVVAECPPGTAPTKWRFLQRNRLMAAATQATVVMEAGFRSGSLGAAAHALKLGRPVGAVPGPVTSASSAGSNALLRDFHVTAVTSASEMSELRTDTRRGDINALLNGSFYSPDAGDDE